MNPTVTELLSEIEQVVTDRDTLLDGFSATNRMRIRAEHDRDRILALLGQVRDALPGAYWAGDALAPLRDEVDRALGRGPRS